MIQLKSGDTISHMSSEFCNIFKSKISSQIRTDKSDHINLTTEEKPDKNELKVVIKNAIK